VKDAVLDAAERLFARSGPGSVSLREIAAEAGITYSLISRHFGTKDELLELLLSRYAQTWEERVQHHAELSDALTDLLGPKLAGSAYLRLLAWSLLTGQGNQVHRTASLLDRLVPMARAQTADDHEAVARTAAALSLIFGWRFFHPFILDALHVSEGDRNAVHSSVATFLSPPGGT